MRKKVHETIAYRLPLFLEENVALLQCDCHIQVKNTAIEMPQLFLNSFQLF